MKKWLTYIMVAMFCIGLASCADVMDEGGGCPEGKATVRLKISMPTAEGAPYSVARETTGEEQYENTIRVRWIYISMFSIMVMVVAWAK